MRAITSRLRVPGLTGAGLIVLLAALGPAMAACGGSAPQAPAGGGWTAPAASMPGMSGPEAPGGSPAGGDVVAAAWAARPAFVAAASAATQEAYRFALEQGNMLRYMPCTCGCAAMEHRSNLDCFLKPGSGADGAAWEQHASACDICVNIALTVKRMAGDGNSLREIRSAIDRTFGGTGAPSTPTELPPA